MSKTSNIVGGIFFIAIIYFALTKGLGNDFKSLSNNFNSYSEAMTACKEWAESAGTEDYIGYGGRTQTRSLRSCNQEKETNQVLGYSKNSVGNKVVYKVVSYFKY
jgi:hypothetical protein